MKKYINNWDELSNEDKIKAKEAFKGNPGLNTNVVHPAAKFFEEHRWVKIDKFIDVNMANLLYHHVQLSAERLNWLQNNNHDNDKEIYGTFEDSQAPGDFSKYGDPIFDALLSLCKSKMEELTAIDLVPTYSYHRLYTIGTELKEHSDRPSCEISTTLCLGYDVSNVDANKYPDWDWPMFIEEKDGTKVPVHMKPGDMIIYRGCELKHWREPFWGNNHAQVFLHYNEKGGKYDIPFDNRPLLGLPANFKKQQSEEVIQEHQNKVMEDQKYKEIFGSNNGDNKTPRKVIY
jgi:hypothetical protein